ncbi:hypothetical protein BDZ91DRAFT_709231 [Kalaharituber pfeilii]|nr:hypothetical protein BDZ91DRAFT_709231 [Kalaharituber pfeilii]
MYVLARHQGAASLWRGRMLNAAYTAATLSSVASAFAKLHDITGSHSFTYHAHAAAIKAPDDATPTPKSSKSRTRLRTSDASESSGLTHTPGSLTADLSHYKELFSKLRFSYLETVTKEKYLREIIEDPPVVHENSENEALERELAEYKMELGGVKQEMADLIEQIEVVAAKLGPESEAVAKKLAELETIPDDLKELEASIQGELEKLGKLPSQGQHDETLHLPLDETLALVRELESELSSIDRDLAHLNDSEIPRKQRLTEQLDNELKPLEMDKAGLIGLATQAKHQREKEREMGRADRENMGRWYNAANEAMTQLLGP